MIILDSVFTGVKRKADQAEMDISVKRKKIPVSEVKKSSLFTKKLLNQFDSAIKSNEFDSDEIVCKEIVKHVDEKKSDLISN